MSQYYPLPSVASPAANPAEARWFLFSAAVYALWQRQPFAEDDREAGRDYVEKLLDWIFQVQESTMLIGTIQAYAGLNAPAKWLKCEGQVVSRVAYAELFAVCGTTYGAGDGSTTFNLPDLRDRAATGASPNYAPGVKYGEASVVLTRVQMPSHRHFNQYVSSGFFAWTATPSTPGVGAQLYTSIANTPNIGSTQFTAFDGDTQPHPNLPPSLALTYLIYAGV